jgi:hypothetical protein
MSAHLATASSVPVVRGLRSTIACDDLLQDDFEEPSALSGTETALVASGAVAAVVVGVLSVVGFALLR